MLKINRRNLISSFALSACILAFKRQSHASSAKVTVGAIRWDPWYMEVDVGPRANMENVLGPQKWQSRAPSCTQVISDDRISLAGCGTQVQIDREIAAADDAGLDYWAYVWYGPNHDLQNAWRFYRSSKIEKKIKWCAIFSNYGLFVREMRSAAVQYASYFQGSDYQKVLGNRPLVYLLHDTTPTQDLLGAISDIRNICSSSGAGNPYIVLLGGLAYKAGLVGADAVGIYSKENAAPVAGAYADLVKTNIEYWKRLAATRQQTVPTVLTGADRRPRVERPVPWEAASQKPYVGDDLYYAQGTPNEIAAHVGDMMSWLKANPAACPAQTGLIYSWDEHDEGGSTLNPTLGGGGAILDAVKRILQR
jgi:hypothetical protein